MAEAGGTRTLLDVAGISDSPELCYASPLDEEEIVKLFGTAKPTLSDVKGTQKYFDGIGRGECRFFVIYSSNETPKSYFFYGFSVD